MSGTLEDGQLCFYNHAEESWTVGTVSGAPDAKGNYKVVDRDKKLGDFMLKREDIYPIMNTEILTEDCDDLLLLSELHQSTLLNTLRARYLRDVVYTYIGPIVIALNPFNYNIPWYKDDFMPNYLVEGHVITKNKPHSWSVAHNTYYEMVDDRQDQCVLVSGESGAGKTEAVKIVIKYLRGLMQKVAKDPGHKDQLEKISHKVLQASPILESFGNAKTGRNDNSSRFGKFLKVQFDNEGFIVGSSAIQYLLEKSRVLSAAQGERVYHSFYQVAKGKDAGQYGLGPAKEYPTLMSGNTLDNASMEDAEGDDLSFKMTNLAYDACGVSSEQAVGVWRTCAGILHLARAKFVADGEGSKIDPSTQQYVDAACKVFEVPSDVLSSELCKTVLEVRGETNTKLHNVAAAEVTRNSLCMSLYKGLFDILVDVINAGTSSPNMSHFIGLLDIFGFEDFPVNSFEQCCINLANETLQNHYNDYIFTKDMEECKAEGVDVTAIEFADNTPTCQLLIQKGTGIFRLLDDECAVGSGNDMGFLEKATGAHGNGKHASFVRAQLDKDSFSIKHYAGTVKYMVADFVAKNKDTLKDALKLLFREKPDHPVIKELLPAPVEKSGRAPTVSNFFVGQITDLMDLINSTNPHWIRCIKPHPAKKPLMFHGVSSMAQMISSGIIETVRLRMLGFPVRIKHVAFQSRFAILAKAECQGVDAPTACQAILKACGYDKAQGQLGKTKVFLKSHIYQDIEERKKAALKEFAIKAQMFARAVGAAIFAGRRKKMLAIKHLQEELRAWLKASQAARAARMAERQAMLDRLKDSLASFDTDEAAGRKAVETDWRAGLGDIGAEMVASYKGVIGSELAHIQKVEATKRDEIEDERTRELKDMFVAAADAWAGILEREQQRLEAIRKEFAVRFDDLIREEEEARKKLVKDEVKVWEDVQAAMQPLLGEVFARMEKTLHAFRRRERKLARLYREKEEEHAREERKREEERHSHQVNVDRWAAVQEAARQRELDRIADVNYVTRRMADSLMTPDSAEASPNPALSRYRDSWRQRYEEEMGNTSPRRSVGAGSPHHSGGRDSDARNYPASPLASPPDGRSVAAPPGVRSQQLRDQVLSRASASPRYDRQDADVAGSRAAASPRGGRVFDASPNAYRPAASGSRYRLFPSARAPPHDHPSRYPTGGSPPPHDSVSPSRPRGSPGGSRSVRPPVAASQTFTLYTGGGGRRVFEVTAHTTFDSLAPGCVITNERGAVYPPGDSSVLERRWFE